MKITKPQAETTSAPAAQPTRETLKVSTRIKCGRRWPFYGVP